MMTHKKLFLNLLACVAVALVFYGSSRHDTWHSALFGFSGAALLVLSWVLYDEAKKAKKPR